MYPGPQSAGDTVLCMEAALKMLIPRDFSKSYWEKSYKSVELADVEKKKKKKKAKYIKEEKINV